MAEYKDIHKFAQDYLRAFTESNPPVRMLESALGDESFQLGFRMDLGESFMRAYSPEAFQSSVQFLEVAPQIVDPYLLGTAIFSKWRLVTHWYEQSVIDGDNRAWFTAALGRLAELTAGEGSDETFLTGKIHQLRLVSNNESTAKRPVLDEETQETLTVTESGRVSFSASKKSPELGGRRIIRTEPPFRISKEEADAILDAAAQIFRYAYTEEEGADDDADAGTWKLTLTNQWGRPYRAAGDLGARILVDGEDLSDLLREKTGRPTLLAFDGNTDRVDHLEVRYRRGVPVAGQKGSGEKGDSVRWVYVEKVAFDRQTETLEHVLEAGPGHRSRTNAYLRDAIPEFLDILDPRTGFRKPEGNPDDAVYPDDEVTEYQVSYRTKQGNQKVYSGSYDLKSLPRDWEVFVDQMLTFLSFFGYGEIFDEARYGRALRRQSDYVYIRVSFGDSPQEFWYRSDDAALKDGDYVLVPHGYKNEPRIAQIQQIEYGSREAAPGPFDDLKKMIRKCEPGDMRSANMVPGENAGAQIQESK